MRSLLDIINCRNRSFDNIDAFITCQLFQNIDLQLWIDFAGTVHGPNIFCLRRYLQKQLQLLVNRIHITGSRNIAFRLVIRSSQLCYLIIGNRRRYNGYIFRSISHRLSRRRSDSTNQIHLIADKTLCDILQIRLISLCVLPVIFYIFIFFKAFRRHTCHKAFIGGIQCTMFYQLGNTNRYHFFTVVSLLFAAAAS